MMARRFALGLVMAAGLRAQTAENTCRDCHAVLEGALARPAAVWEHDIHRKQGFSCVDCHGGDSRSADPEVSMSRARGFLGKIDRRAVPALCARCHSDVTLIHRFKPQQRVDQLAQYQTSVHGKRLAAGDARVANCVDCHAVHEIREVHDAEAPVHPLRLPETCARCHADAARMQLYKIPTNQFEQYRRSVHWQALAQRGDLSAPSCASCHGNHGAVPPGVKQVSHVCGSCHVAFENLFAKSPHKKAFDDMGIAGCVVCHGNHEVSKPTLAMLGVQPGSTCVNCHSEGDRGYQAAAGMRLRIEELAASLQRSEVILRQAESSGMEVSGARVQLGAANESLIKSRVELHSFDPAVVEASVTQGLKLAQATYRAGEKALQERDYRRRGLALSLASIAVVMAGLWLAVRELDRRRRGQSSS